jgi:hypothetical protein
MLQRNPRLQGVGVAVALVLFLALAAAPPVQAQAPAGPWQVSSILQFWWSGLAAKIAAPGGTSGVAAEPTQVDTRRSATLDPNGLKSGVPAFGRESRAPRQGSGRPRG